MQCVREKASEIVSRKPELTDRSDNFAAVLPPLVSIPTPSSSDPAKLAPLPCLHHVHSPLLLPAPIVTSRLSARPSARTPSQDVDADDVEQEFLDDLVVGPSHFDWAMTKTAPSSLRDKSVEMPDVSWNDVGGLLDVKREMIETLTYPLK